MLLIILGVFLFLYHIIQFHSLSSTAVVSFISGIALISLANAASVEIEKLRVESNSSINCLPAVIAVLALAVLQTGILDAAGFLPE
jgi:uncharacterized membrane protein YhaH (DUF805 family)